MMDRILEAVKIHNMRSAWEVQDVASHVYRTYFPTKDRYVWARRLKVLSYHQMNGWKTQTFYNVEVFLATLDFKEKELTTDEDLL